jgi:hypothetical protein
MRNSASSRTRKPPFFRSDPRCGTPFRALVGGSLLRCDRCCELISVFWRPGSADMDSFSTFAAHRSGLVDCVVCLHINNGCNKKRLVIHRRLFRRAIASCSLRRCDIHRDAPGASDLTTARPLAGLGSFISAKVCVLFVYLCVFGLTTEWMGSEVIIGICYLVFSLATTYVALMLFNALSLGGYAAAEAGFSDGCQDDRGDERRPLKQQQHAGYQTQYI